MGSFSPNSVLLIHHEFEGVLDMYSLFFLFLRSIRGSLYIALKCICIGLWPSMNDSCSFLKPLMLIPGRKSGQGMGTEAQSGAPWRTSAYVMLGRT
jgi:hypothetical protein